MKRIIALGADLKGAFEYFGHWAKRRPNRRQEASFMENDLAINVETEKPRSQGRER